MLPNQNKQVSPQLYARTGGLIYLIIILAGMFGELFVRAKLVVPGDADATAHNILSHELLWRLGIAVDLFMQVCDIPSILIFYVLLKPVSKNLAIMAVLFNMIQTAVLVANKLNLLAAWSLISGGDGLQSLQPQQLNGLGRLFIRQHEQGFGCWIDILWLFLHIIWIFNVQVRLFSKGAWYTAADRRFMLHHKQLCADHRPKFRSRVVSFYFASFFYRGIGCLPLAAD